MYELYDTVCGGKEINGTRGKEGEERVNERNVFSSSDAYRS